MKSIFPLLHERVHINLRDQISYDRYVKFTGTTPNFVADVAFLLEPDNASVTVAENAAWIAARRQSGKKVIGFNIHPMLFRDSTPERVAAIIAIANKTLSNVYKNRDVAFLLVSHDSRKHHGDDICLEPIFAHLKGELADDIRLTPSTLSAAEIKAISGLLDGVVTARMHLAIATLGQGVPVAAVTYQDKFQGLFQHFGIDLSYAMAPQDYLIDGRLESMILHFVDELAPLREMVESRRPAVLALAEGNFAGVIPENLATTV